MPPWQFNRTRPTGPKIQWWPAYDFSSCGAFDRCELFMRLCGERGTDEEIGEVVRLRLALLEIPLLRWRSRHPERPRGFPARSGHQVRGRQVTELVSNLVRQ